MFAQQQPPGPVGGAESGFSGPPPYLPPHGAPPQPPRTAADRSSLSATSNVSPIGIFPPVVSHDVAEAALPPPSQQQSPAAAALGAQRSTEVAHAPVAAAGGSQMPTAFDTQSSRQ